MVHYLSGGVATVGALTSILLIGTPLAAADSNTGFHWHSARVEYKISRSTPAEWVGPIMRAETEWRDRTRFDIVPSHILYTDSTNPNTAEHIVWRGTIPSAWHGGCPPATTLACTRTFRDANRHITDADIVFNQDQSLGDSDFWRCTLGIGYDVQTVALHEYGHFGGLGHDPDSSTVMYGTYNDCQRALTATDIRSMQNNYPGH